MITPPEICPVPGTLLAVQRHLSLRERETDHGFRKRRTALAARRTVADHPAAGSVLASLMCATDLNLACARIRFGTCAPDMYFACERLRTIYFPEELSTRPDGFHQFVRPERLLQKARVSRQGRRITSRHDDDTERGIFLLGVFRELDARHLARELNIRHQRAQLEPRGRKHKLGGFGRRAFDHFKPLALEHVSQRLALEAVVFHDQGCEKCQGNISDQYLRQCRLMPHMKVGSTTSQRSAADVSSCSRDALRPSFSSEPPSSYREGAGKAGCPHAPMVRVQQKSTRQNHRYRRINRPSLRNGFTAYT